MKKLTIGLFLLALLLPAGAIAQVAGGPISGGVGLATALAANGANCSAGSFPLGVDASGAAESCSTVLADGAVITVGASGADFTTVQAAVAYVDSIPVQTGQVVTIRIADGTYANVTPIDLSKPRQVALYIAGTNTYARTMSSVQSSSGSAGAWSITLNVNSVANIAVDDWVLITSPSGGTLPTYIAGAHKVTNVDAVNTRITITSVHKNVTAPSGAISATVTVLKTILTFAGSDGVRVWDSALFDGLSKLMLVGDGSARNGLSVQDASRCYSGASVGVSGFFYNVFSLYNSEINGAPIVASGAVDDNFHAAAGGIISLASGSVASGSANDGIEVSTGGLVDLGVSITTGNVAAGIRATYGGVVAGTTSSSGNGYGALVSTGGYNDRTTVTNSTNTNLDNRNPDLSVSGLTIDTALRPKTFTYEQSSPWDRLKITANSSAGGWKGVVDLLVSLSAGTPVNGFSVAANTSTTAIATLNAALIATPVTVTVASAGVAIPITATTVEVTTDGNSDEDNGTLANGAAVGQILYVYVKAVGNAADSFKITPATMLGGTKVSFAANPLGKGCTLIWTASGWVVVGSNGGTVS